MDLILQLAGDLRLVPSTSKYIQVPSSLLLLGIIPSFNDRSRCSLQFARIAEAFQKPVLSSSFRSATEHAYKAVDGDVESQWASVSLNDQWLWVDLLGLYAVNRVVLLFGDVPQQFVPGITRYGRL